MPNPRPRSTISATIHGPGAARVRHARVEAATSPRPASAMRFRFTHSTRVDSHGMSSVAARVSAPMVMPMATSSPPTDWMNRGNAKNEK